VSNRWATKQKPARKTASPKYVIMVPQNSRQHRTKAARFVVWRVWLHKFAPKGVIPLVTFA
jgi:hypothetical protein